MDAFPNMATHAFAFLIWQLFTQTLGALKQRRGDVVGARDALRRSAKFGGGARAPFPLPSPAFDRPATLCPFRAFRLPSGQDILLLPSTGV